MNALKYLTLMSVVVIFASFFLFASPASASAHTFVWNNHGSYVPMYYAPTTLYNNVKLWMSNGTYFDMRCWTDNQNFTGNYTTNRWFWGQEYSHGYWGYIHASYVYNQTSVPHC